MPMASEPETSAQNERRSSCPPGTGHSRRRPPPRFRRSPGQSLPSLLFLYPSLFLLRSLWSIPSSSFQASCSKSCVAMNCNCELRFFFFLFYQLISLINVVFLRGLWSYGDQIWEVLWGGMDGLCWGEAMWWTWFLL